MKNKNAKRFKGKNSTAKRLQKNERLHQKQKHTKNTFKIFITILFIILICTLIYFICTKSKDNNSDKNSNTSNNTNVVKNLDFDNVNKPVTNYESLEASDLKITATETQSSVSITLKNTSSKVCPKLVLSISLLDSQNQTVVTFDAYTLEIAPNGNQILQMYTKQDISNVTDFSISKK